MNTELWLKLRNFHPDSGEKYPFSKRLANENGWSLEFALQAIDEYKRFIYLCCEAGHLVTPSTVVDQVWHLHLIYTINYWKEFCGKVLEKEIHHGPTKGGVSEGLKYKEAYSKTLISYKEHFGIDPPPEFWDPASQRFKQSRFQWIDLNKYWILRRWKLWIHYLGFRMS